MIGHIQRNKAKKAIQLFDVLETVDSLRLAQTIDRRCALIGKVIPVLVEINSGEETNKTGVLPKDIDEFMNGLASLDHIYVQGLMTMGHALVTPNMLDHTSGRQG
jgi:hypothetical protein